VLGFRTNADLLLTQSPSPRVFNWSEMRQTLAHGILLPKPIQLDLMRHGETVTNAKGLVTGSQDVPLTQAGEEQARRIGLRLDRHYELALHSTLDRSLKTLLLALLAGHIKVDQILADPRLNERSLGILELRPWAPVEEYAQGDLYYAPAGGESYAEVARRCLSLLLDLVDFVVAVLPERILVSGHMGPMRILIGILEEQHDPVVVLARSFENTEIVRVHWRRLVLPGFMMDLF